MRLLLATALTALGAFAGGLGAQDIQRCEAPGGAITYSNEACPPGTRPVRAVQAAPQPSSEAQEAARTQLQRDEAASRAASERRRQQQAQVAEQQAVQRATDCAYLRAEVDSTRRMRNVLTTRPYYSLDDVAQMDKHAAQLAADYRRLCS